MNLPKNLNLHFEDYCKDCPIADVDISKLEINSFEFVDETIYDVYCKHEKACEMMHKYRGTKFESICDRKGSGKERTNY